MLKNYFKIAIRSLRRNKTYSFINITGLSVSLAVSILLLLWVHDEISFDRFNVNAARLYKLAPTFTIGGTTTTWDATSAPLGVFAKKEVPEVANSCRLGQNWAVSYFEYGGRKINEFH